MQLVQFKSDTDLSKQLWSVGVSNGLLSCQYYLAALFKVVMRAHSNLRCHFLGFYSQNSAVDSWNCSGGSWLQPADTHPADVLAASAGREGLRADDGAAPHEGRGVTPAAAPLLGTDPHRLREQAVRHGGLLHLQGPTQRTRRRVSL